MPFEDAYRQQLAHWRADLDSGAHRIGWKIGYNHPVVMERLGLDEPLVGHLTSSTLIGADGAHSLAGAENPKAEPEIVIEVGPDHTVFGVALAIEIVDVAAPVTDHEGVHDLVATNIFHRAVAIGLSKPAETLAEARGVLTVSGEEHESTAPSAVDLEGTVALVARTLEAAGERLETGDRIIAGTLVAPPPVISPGDLVTFDGGPIGSIELTLSA